MSNNPHIRDIASPLESLVAQALRRYGDFAPSTVDGAVALLFLDFANEIVDDVQGHPYYDGDPIPHYKSVSEAREQIPDRIMIAGLLAKYAEQQFSDKATLYIPNYYRTLNRQLWLLRNGGDYPRPEIATFDKADK